MKKSVNKLWGAINLLLLLLFLPVLFCVIFIGNRMDYYDGWKMEIGTSNFALFLLSVAGICVLLFLFRFDAKVRLTRKVNNIVNVCLFAFFVVFYFVNVRITREIAFKLPWDIMLARAAAYDYAAGIPFGYQYYMSIFTNNIPLTYVMGVLYKIAMKLPNYPYVRDFLWLQVNCGLISAAGYFNCLLVKRLTKSFVATMTALALFSGLVGLSPWKIATYTDVYGLLFPVLCVYLYVCYRQTKSGWGKYLLLVLTYLAGTAGALMKPNIFLILIAIVCVECVFTLSDWRGNLKYLVVEIGLAAVMLFARNACMDKIIEEIGLEFNEELEASWQYYIYMGLNEEFTGGFNDSIVGMFGEFQYSRSDRNVASLERAMDIVKERGFVGTLYFWLRKMVMTFNDGMFGWRTEVWIDEYYPASLASNTALTEFLRDIYWMGSRAGACNTLCQMVWIFCLLGLPGACLVRKEDRERFCILAVCFLGVFFYQIFFEARGRYLFAFLPLIISLSVCGMQQYADRVLFFLRRRGVRKAE